MSHKIINRVQNDTSPDEVFTITRKGGGAVDLTPYPTIKFAIRSNLTGTITNTAHQNCVVVSAAAGTCKYVFVAGDLPDAGGDYRCDLQLTDASGKIETYYDDIIIRTRAEIAV